MAVAAELSSRLERDGEPLAKRLCLAKNVFQSPLIPVPRKEEVVINWLCKIPGKLKKKSKKLDDIYAHDDLSSVWSTLKLCISSIHMQRLGAATIRPSTKDSLLKVLSKHLERRNLTEAEHISLVECSLSILEAGSFQRYFRTNISFCMSFVSALITSLSNLGSDHSSLCVKGVSSIQAIFRQTVLRKELCLTFLDVILVPLIELGHSMGNQPSPLSTEIYRCIQQVLFPKTASDFPQFLDEVFKESKNIADPIANLPCSEAQFPIPFKLIHILMESEKTLSADSYVALFSTVFRSFVASFKSSPRSLVFKMAVVMCYLNGFEVKNPKCNVPYLKLKETVKKGDKELSSSSLRVLQGIVFILSQWSFSLNGEICGTRFLDWLQLLVDGLFPLHTNLSEGPPLIELASSLVKLNPLIVESNVKNILVAITRKPLADEVKPCYSLLISSLSSMYFKLSRVPTFATVLVTSLKAGLEYQSQSGLPCNNVVEWLPPKVISELTQHISMSPSSSSIATLNVLVDELMKNCLAPLQQSETPKSNGTFEIYTRCVCELICAVLKGVRLLEQSTAAKAREGFCNILKQLRQCLHSFGHVILNAGKNSSALFCSFLNVSYHWAAEALLIEQYADVGREELLVSVGSDLKVGCQTTHGGAILSYLHPYLSSEEWTRVYDLIVECNEDNCKELLIKLDFQLLSALRMFSPSQSTASMEVAKRSCAQLEQLMKGTVSGMIDQSTAFNLILMTPLLSVTNLVVLSNNLIDSFLAQETETLSNEFISLLLEDRSLACGLVCSTLASLKRVLKAPKRKSNGVIFKRWKTVKEVLGKLDVEILMQGELQESHSLEQANVVISSMAALTEESLVSSQSTEEQVNGEDYDFSNIVKHLHLLKVFPLAFLSSSSQAAVFLSLLSLGIDCSHFPNSTAKDSVMKEIFNHLLLSLLERGSRLSLSLEGHIHYGLLINCLANVTVFHGVGQRLLDLVLSQSIHQEKLHGQIFDKVALMSKKARNQKPGRESLVVGTLLLQLLSSKTLRMFRSAKSSGNSSESANQPLNQLKKARRKLVKSFESLIANELVVPEDVLHAYALCLDFKLKFDEDIEYLSPHLDKFCKSALSSLSSADLFKQKEAESLILVLLQHRGKLHELLPSGLTKDVWSCIFSMSKPSEALVTVIFESASEDEMSFLLENLLLVTEKTFGCEGEDDKASENRSINVIKFWRLLLGCQNLPAVNNEKGVNAIRSLFQNFKSLKNISHQQLLEFVHTALLSSKFTMDMEMVDQAFFLLHETSLPETIPEFTSIAQQYLSVLSALLLHRSSLALDCIPSFLQALQRLIKQIAVQSKQSSELSRANGALLAGLAFGVEKLISACTKPDKRKSFKRVAAYLLADVINLFETITLYAAVKVHLQNIVFALLNIIDEHSIKFLLRVMSPASTEIFRNLYDNYKKYHRFTGKV